MRIFQVVHLVMTQSFLLYSILYAIIDLVIPLLVDMWAFYSFLFSVLKHVNVNNLVYVSRRTGTEFFSSHIYERIV